MRRIGRLLALPAALAGAFLGAAIVAAQPGGTGLHGLLLGWFYGLVVGGLMRLFALPAGALPLAGALAGPLPFALLMPVSASQDERGLIWVGMLAGLVLGCVEWAHARRRTRPPAAPACGQAPEAEGE
jgi:hypothetical protein